MRLRLSSMSENKNREDENENETHSPSFFLSLRSSSPEMYAAAFRAHTVLHKQYSMHYGYYCGITACLDLASD